MGRLKLFITKDEWVQYCHKNAGSLYSRCKYVGIPLRDKFNCSCGECFEVLDNLTKKKIKCPKCGALPTFTEIWRECNTSDIALEDVPEKLNYRFYESNRVKYTFFITKTNKNFLELVASETKKSIPEILNDFITEEHKRYNSRKSKRKSRGSVLFDISGGSK